MFVTCLTAAFRLRTATKTMATCYISHNHHHNSLFPLLDSYSDSDTDSYTMQRDPNLNPSQWKHVLHNTMYPQGVESESEPDSEFKSESESKSGSGNEPLQYPGTIHIYLRFYL